MKTARARSRPAGFSLIELMVASAIMLIVFAAATYGAVQLQKRGTLEEGLADVQDVARGARELIAPRIERAGAGMSNLILTVGSSGADADLRTTLTVTTASVTPPVPYDALKSDSLDIYWAEGTTAMTPIRAAPCTAGVRNGNDACVQRLPQTLAGTLLLNANDYVMFANVNPTVATSCLFKVASVVSGGGANPDRITLDSAVLASGAPAGSACTNQADGFWAGGTPYAAKMGGASFRIDWSTGTPRLQYDPDGWWNATAGWQTVADNVEQMRVRVGVVSFDLLNPNPVPGSAPLAPPPVVWFPSRADDASAPTTARPPLDQCTTTNNACKITAVAGGNADATNFPDKTDAIDGRIVTLMGATRPDAALQAQLMRRARMIELDLTVRSARQDLTAIQRQGAGYKTDSTGNPLDGRNRRHYEMKVSLRNYGYAGI